MFGCDYLLPPKNKMSITPPTFFFFGSTMLICCTQFQFLFVRMMKAKEIHAKSETFWVVVVQLYSKNLLAPKVYKS